MVLFKERNDHRNEFSVCQFAGQVIVQVPVHRRDGLALIKQIEQILAEGRGRDRSQQRLGLRAPATAWLGQ